MQGEPRNRFQTDKFTLASLQNQEHFDCTKDFDCGDADLNEFFIRDAFLHKQELLAETYYFQPAKATEEDLIYPVAFVSFLNDSISVKDWEKESSKKEFWDKMKNSLPDEKQQYRSYPAVKIGRLGVRKQYQRKGFGTALLNMVKEFFLTENRTGCKFVTVDAYNNTKTIGFYKKNGFDFLSEKDKKNKTRIMYFDLMRHKKEKEGRLS